MIIGALKCKLCGQEIEPPKIVLGDSPEQRDARIVQKLMKHLEQKAEIEKPKGGPHLHAIRSAAERAMNISANLNGALLTGNFELPESLEQQRIDLLRQVHEMTRQVRMSDEELNQWLTQKTIAAGGTDDWEMVYAIAQDLRDRYESLGKYAAPKPANTPAAPEVVKQ